MLTRLYFLLPNRHQTQRVIDELQTGDLKIRNMLAMEKQDITNQLEQHNSVWKRLDITEQIEKYMWPGNLIIFSLAFIVFLISMFTNNLILLGVTLIIMLTTFVLGTFFANHIPRIHLDEFNDALSHGEVLLMLEAPKAKIADIEDLILRHHPSAILGGSSWTLHLPSV